MTVSSEQLEAAGYEIVNYADEDVLDDIDQFYSPREFSGNFDIDISFVWDRTQDPPPLADGTLPERDDYRLLVGLSYEF